MRNWVSFDDLPKAAQFGGIIYKFGLVADPPHTLSLIGQAVIGRLVS